MGVHMTLWWRGHCVVMGVGMGVVVGMVVGMGIGVVFVSCCVMLCCVVMCHVVSCCVVMCHVVSCCALVGAGMVGVHVGVAVVSFGGRLAYRS